jgi:hypothetical protein
MRRLGDRIDRHQFFESPALKLTDVMAGLGPPAAMWRTSEFYGASRTRAIKIRPNER